MNPKNIKNKRAMETKQLFARVCDITGEGMNEGWCWADGMFYTKNYEDTIKELRKEFTDESHLTDEELLTEACENEVLYWTDWYDCEMEYEQVNGELIDLVK